LATDSGWVAIWQGSVAVAAFAQIALLTHFFGIAEYGRFAIIVAFVELVAGFFNPRINYASTTFGARWLVRDPRVAVGVFQYGWLIDLVMTAAGIAVLAVLAFTAGSHLPGSDSTGLILLYTLALLGPTLTRSAFVVLRLLDRFGLIATYAWALELTRIVLIVVAIQLFDSIAAVLVAIVIATLAAGIIDATVAACVLRRSHGLRLTRSHLGGLERTERKAMLKNTAHTLVISSGRMVNTQLPTVLLGALAGATQAGIYKIGMAAAAAIGLAIGPASNALLPRLARLWSAERFKELQRLVSVASTISAVVMALGFIAVVVFQGPILRLLGGGQAGEAASTVLLVGAASQALYGLVFWHNTLLFAANRTGPMSVVSVVSATVHIAAIFALVPTLEATGAALAVLASQALANVALTTLALRTLRSARDAEADPQAPAPAPVA
jgi:O-antigen/teichoic acid export membrane protein